MILISEISFLLPGGLIKKPFANPRPLTLCLQIIPPNPPYVIPHPPHGNLHHGTGLGRDQFHSAASLSEAGPQSHDGQSSHAFVHHTR